MKFYFDIQKQTSKMRTLFEEDESNYEYIHHKLLTQTELRDNLIDKMRQRGENLDRLEQEFSSLSDFERSFYSKIFTSFSNTPTLARNNPNHLVQLVRIITSGDAFMKEKNKPERFKPAAIESIHAAIDERFNLKLSGAVDVVAILDKTK